MSQHTVITRDVAHAQGLRHYYTGTPCKAGHLATRFVSTGNCTRCATERQQKYTKGAKSSVMARMQGHFQYPLHPDDHAAALAYCQSLDIGRGRRPHVPGVNAVPPPVAFVLPEHIARAQQALVATQVQPERDSDYPDFKP